MQHSASRQDCLRDTEESRSALTQVLRFSVSSAFARKRSSRKVVSRSGRQTKKSRCLSHDAAGTFVGRSSHWQLVHYPICSYLYTSTSSATTRHTVLTTHLMRRRLLQRGSQNHLRSTARAFLKPSDFGQLTARETAVDAKYLYNEDFRLITGA